MTDTEAKTGGELFHQLLNQSTLANATGTTYYELSSTTMITNERRAVLGIISTGSHFYRIQTL